MASRSTGDVKRELASERERLERAATTLKTQSGDVAKRVAISVGIAVAAAITVKIIASRVFTREEPETEERARLPFLRRD
jgi:hypothetical protein